MINGDFISGIKDRCLYFIQCLRQHREGVRLSVHRELVQDSLGFLELKLTPKDSFIGSKTPARFLCDSLWASIDYQRLADELGSSGRLGFFDIGCGDGIYGTFFKELSGNAFGSYTGLDIYKSKIFPAEFEHIKDSAENCHKWMDERVNLVVSQSALEHIEYDRQVLRCVTARLEQTRARFVQIHMIPAARSLWLYRWHGWRQYSELNLESIVSELAKEFQISWNVVPIGGSASFIGHLCVTLSSFACRFGRLVGISLKDGFLSYGGLRKYLQKFVEKDLRTSSKNPLFYALIISSPGVSVKFLFNKPEA